MQFKKQDKKRLTENQNNYFSVTFFKIFIPDLVILINLFQTN